jgi:tyrosine-protein phosphatase SIW14
MRLRHSLPAGAALFVSVFALALPGATPASREEVRGVPNFAVVSPILSRGAQPTREGFCRLSERGVRTIVSLRSAHGDDAALAGLELSSFRIHARQWDPETEDVVRAMKVILTPEYQPVFVHCQAGKDRTGLVVAVYRILVDGWSVDEAIAERKAFGAWGFWWQNKAYLRRLGDVETRRDLVAAIEAAPVPLVVRVP